MLSLLWLGATLGTTFILTRSSLFAPLRALFPKKKGQAPTLGTLVRCPKCVGTWMGALWALLFALVEGASVGGATLVVELGPTIFARPAPWLVAVYLFAYGTSGAAACWLADLVFRKLGGDKVLSHERHPWQDIPVEKREEVISMLRWRAAAHVDRSSATALDDVKTTETKYAEAYTTAIDALES